MWLSHEEGMFPSCAGNHEEVKGRICQASSTGILELLQGLQRSVDVQRCAPRDCDGLSCMPATGGKPATGGGIGKPATGGKPGLYSGRGGGGVEEKEERETEKAKDLEQPQEWSERDEETHMGIWAEGCIEDEEEEWKKRRRERRKRRRLKSNHRSGASERRRRIWALGQSVVLRTHLGTWEILCIQTF